MRNIRSIIASGLVIALSSCGTSVTKVEHNPAVPQTEYAASLINSYVPSMQKGYKIKSEWPKIRPTCRRKDSQ